MYKIDQIETVLFDLDGTLTDSGPGVINAVGYAIEKLGLPYLPPEERAYFVGPPLLKAFEEKLGLSGETAQEAVRLFREYYVPTGVYENALYPGVADMLARLRAADRRLMVCSAKPQFLAEKVLEHFGIGSYFEIVAAAALNGEYTQKNAIIRRLFEQNRIGPAVLVGDRRFDCEAARHAGILAAAVTWGYAAPGELAAAGPDYTVDSPAQLTDLILLGGKG
ncbi:MAG: HAD hydrolase-like protein [Eubacteriales bacterium]|nr:HAD hydrolase-like protein [Eubacteriales bacterium]